jgi:hypothetical protein
LRQSYWRAIEVNREFAAHFPPSLRHSTSAHQTDGGCSSPAIG